MNIWGKMCMIKIEYDPILLVPWEHSNQSKIDELNHSNFNDLETVLSHWLIATTAIKIATKKLKQIYDLMHLAMLDGIDYILHIALPQIARLMGPTWVLSAPDGPHVGPMNLDIRVYK